MRRNRIIWLCLWILSLVGISFRGGPISYGFFIVVSMVFVTSLLYVICVYIFFRIYQKADGVDFTVNETIPFYFTLVNDFFFPFAGVSVKFFSSFSTISGLDDNIEYELMPKTGIRKDTGLICHYRGEYEVGIKSVEIQDYFRLFKISYKNKETKRVFVKPMLVRLENLGSLDIDQSSREIKMSQSENDILCREYIQGDDPRLINWAQSARTGNLFVRTRTGQDKEGVSIFVDTCRYSDEPGEYLCTENKVLETVLALSFYLHNHKIPLSEYHFCNNLVKNDISPNGSFDALYQSICEVSFDEKNTLGSFFEMLIPKREVLANPVAFWVVASFDACAADFIQKLEKNGVNSVIYYIGEEKKEVSRYLQSSKAELVFVPREADLKEVLR